MLSTTYRTKKSS